MSVGTYADLKAEIANHVDFDYSDNDLDTFIDLAEAKINRELRVSAMISSLSATISSGVIAVPTGFRELLHAYVSGSPVEPLEAVSADWLFRAYPDRSSDGKPKYLARVGNNFEFGPYPDSSYTIGGAYYGAFTALSSSSTTNWLTTNAPDMLLFACLEAANRFNRDDVAASGWADLYEMAKRAVLSEEMRSRHARGIKQASKPG